MGKKRIKIIGGELPEKKTKAGLPGTTSLPAGRASRRLVKSGKEHGRITDMGAVALEEYERKLLDEKKESLKAQKKTEGTKKKRSVIKKRGKRYLAAKKLVDRNKLYSLPKAIKLLKKTSISRFNGTVEVHLVTREKGLKREIKLPHQIGKQAKLVIATEKKVPLIHLVIGKVDTKNSYLAENFAAVIAAVGPKNIKKAVLTSTMGPGIKVDLNSI